MPRRFKAYNCRSGPDVIVEEIATVSVGKADRAIKTPLTVVFNKLYARKLVAGKRTLRFRVCEKLQGMIKKGMVDKAPTNGINGYLNLASLVSVLPSVPEAA